MSICDNKRRAIRNNFTYKVAERFKEGKYFLFGFKTIFWKVSEKASEYIFQYMYKNNLEGAKCTQTRFGVAGSYHTAVG